MSYFIRLIFKQKNTSHTEHVARPHKPNITSVWKDEIHKRIKRELKVEVLRPVLLAITDWRYVFVADFGALPYQATRKFIRCRNAETRTNPAIKYTACVCPA